MRALHLTLHRRWFDAIASGEKREEYREMSPHWRRQFTLLPGVPLPWEEIHFRNGYHRVAPWMRVQLLSLRIGIPPGETTDHYILTLGKILEVRNYP